MEFRWSPLLLGLVTALGSAACSDDDDEDDNVRHGGSAGSSASSGGSSGSGGSSSEGGAPSSASSKAGLTLSLGTPNPPIAGTECFPAGMRSLGDPPPTLDPLSPGVLESDGDSELIVVCSVQGPDTFSVSATVDRDALRFKVSNATIDAAAGTGTFKLLVATEEAGDIVSEAEQPCTFDVSEPPLEVSEGKLFATFECPVLWNHATATDTACGAEGVLVLDCAD